MEQTIKQRKEDQMLKQQQEDENNKLDKEKLKRIIAVMSKFKELDPEFMEKAIDETGRLVSSFNDDGLISAINSCDEGRLNKSFCSHYGAVVKELKARKLDLK